MTDLISRQAAIDAIEFGITYARAINKETGEVTPMFERENKALEDSVERIRQLPTIDPVKHGKWKTTPYTDYDDAWECSACGCLWTFIEGTPKDNGANYCPHCGARMDGGEG